MEKIALERLVQERRDFKKNRLFGFYAKPSKQKDGTLNMFKWECGIPGPKSSPWEGGLYELTLEFPEDFPMSPPKAKFKDKLFHPNIYPSGAVCLSILNEEEDWRPSLKINDVSNETLFTHIYILDIDRNTKFAKIAK
jgi:ubiquitin-conjugating enzyme E2 I